MEGCEDGCSPPQRNNISSPATSYSHQSTATLTPSPHEESQVPNDIPRLNRLDSQQLSLYVMFCTVTYLISCTEIAICTRSMLRVVGRLEPISAFKFFHRKDRLSTLKLDFFFPFSIVAKRAQCTTVVRTRIDKTK